MNKTLKMILISVLVVIAVWVGYIFLKSTPPPSHYKGGGYIELLDTACLLDSSKKTMFMTVYRNGIVHTAHGCYYIDSSNIVHIDVSTDTVFLQPK